MFSYSFGWLSTAIAMALWGVISFRSQAATLTMDLSTGEDPTGVVQTTSGAADANWTINASPALVLTPSSADWWGGWAGNDSKSAWIAKDPTTNHNGTGVYSRTFDLTGADLNTISFSGKWAVDDEGTLTLNGHEIGAYQPHDGWQSYPTQTPFNVTDPTWFSQGLNTLSLTIANSDNFHEGVRLSASLTASTPEPTALGCAAVTGMVLLRRRVRR
jgi:hypothetical protein